MAAGGQCAPASIEEGHPKRPQPSVLRVALLRVAQTPDQLVNRHWLLIGEQVPLRLQAARVDENVGVRCTASKSSPRQHTDAANSEGLVSVEALEDGPDKTVAQDEKTNNPETSTLTSTHRSGPPLHKLCGHPGETSSLVLHPPLPCPTTAVVT